MNPKEPTLPPSSEEQAGKKRRAAKARAHAAKSLRPNAPEGLASPSATAAPRRPATAPRRPKFWPCSGGPAELRWPNSGKRPDGKPTRCAAS